LFSPSFFLLFTPAIRLSDFAFFFFDMRCSATRRRRGLRRTAFRHIADDYTEGRSLFSALQLCRDIFTSDC